MNKIKQVVKHFDGQYKLAAALGVSSVAVHWWVKDNKIPPRRAIEIEKLTDGLFKAVELSGGDNE